MRKQISVPSENYWPGYVDALVNVVLNLVFMTAVFGIALAGFNSEPKASILASEVRRPPATDVAHEEGTMDRREVEKEPHDPTVADIPPTFRFIVFDTPQRVGSVRAQIWKRNNALGRSVIGVDVPMGAGPIAAIDQSYFKDALLSVLPMNAASYLVIASAPTSDPILRRSVFLTAAEIRNQMIGVGIAPPRMSIRILDGPSSSTTSQRFFIVANQ